MLVCSHAGMFSVCETAPVAVELEAAGRYSGWGLQVSAEGG